MKKISERFTNKLRHHKTLMANMFKTEDLSMIMGVKKTAQELALAYAEFKCEKCGVDDSLQYHHLIQKNTKSFMYLWKYLTQRNYWANIVILCKSCHQEIEQRINTNDKSGTISKKVINKIKRVMWSVKK